MKRFQMDRAVMVKRWRQEWENHGRDFGACHCGRGMGTMRKHRPFEGHGAKCGICGYEQFLARLERRRTRYAGRASIDEGLADLKRS